MNGQQEITLKINVKDGEVVASTASLNRMNEAAKSVGSGGSKALGDFQNNAGKLDSVISSAAKRAGVSYQEMEARIKSASGAAKGSAAGMNAAKTAITETSEAAKDLSTSSSASGEALTGLAAKAGPVGAVLAGLIVVVAAVVAGVFQAGRVIFQAGQEFAAYAMEIGKASEETGLATETISALRNEAERSGRSIDVLNGPVAAFRKNIGEAAAGSAKARADLRALGIDAKTAMTDVDGAFRKAIETIVKTKDPVEQARLAFAAFGDEGTKILPFLKEFDGDVQKAVDRARELGIEISGNQVKGAKEFTAAYSDLQKVIRGVWNEIGEKFLPVAVGAMRDLTAWVQQNKAEIVSWGTSIGNIVTFALEGFRSVIRFIQDNPVIMDAIRFAFKATAIGGILTAAANSTPSAVNTPLSTVPQEAGGQPDTAALAAMRDYQEKLRQEREKENKAELAAQIKLVENQLSATASKYDEFFKKLTDDLKSTGDLSFFEQNFQALKQWYGEIINDVGGQWEGHVRQQIAADQKGGSQRVLQESEVQTKLQQLADKTLKHEDEAKKAIAETQKKAAADYLTTWEKAMNRRIELDKSSSTTRIAQLQRDLTVGLVTEEQFIQAVNKLELDSIEKRRDELQKYLREVTGNGEKEKEVQHQIKIVDDEITQQKIKNADRVTESIKKEQQARDEILKQFQEYQNGLQDELDVLLRGGRPLSVYEQTTRDIARNHKDWSDAQKESTLDLAKQIDLVEELNKQHEQLREFFADSLTYLFEGDLKGFGQNLMRGFRDQFVDNLSNFLATEILGFDPNGTDNPIAKPIVGKIDRTNKLLEQIVRSTGQTPAMSGLGSLGGLFSGLGNLGGGGGSGPGGTPYFNPSGGGMGSAPSTGGGLQGLISQILGGGGGGGSNHELGHILGGGNGGGGGGLLSRISGPGGIFGEEGFGNNAGTYGAIGAGAGIIGGLIGGRAGSVIGSVGSGLAMGAQIGSMFMPGIGTAIGAAVGAVAGLFAGLLAGDPKRKRDKEEKIPALNKGFTEAMADLRKILEDVRFLRIDPDEAVSRAQEVRAQIASGFGVQFESKKYRQQAQTQIRGRLSEADGIIAQIKAAADISRGAADRRERILPEFAGGNYFADFFKPNGLMPGAFDGRDNIFAMISRGEMVLNPMQMGKVRALAGFDVFAGAGIPNYPNQVSSAKLATGGIAGTGLGLAMSPNIVVQPNMTLFLSGVTFEDGASAWLESDGGKRTLVKVVTEEKKAKRL